jgi:hypothetical protein
MIERVANMCSAVRSEFLDLNHTSKLMIPVSHLICEVRSGRWLQGVANFANRDTRW